MFGHTKKRWNGGTDDGSVYAGQPSICLSHRNVYDGTNVHLERRALPRGVDKQVVNQINPNLQPHWLVAD